MKQITLETLTNIYLLGCVDDLEVLDEETIEVAAPDWLDGGRMLLDRSMVHDLILWGDHESLGEIGIEVLSSVSRASLN
jgi:hypothetical protein